jgi:hypothetical protein
LNILNRVDKTVNDISSVYVNSKESKLITTKSKVNLSNMINSNNSTKSTANFNGNPSKTIKKFGGI